MVDSAGVCVCVPVSVSVCVSARCACVLTVMYVRAPARARVCRVTRRYVLASQCVPYCPARHLLTAVCESVPTAVPARILVTGTEESRGLSRTLDSMSLLIHCRQYIYIYIYIYISQSLSLSCLQSDRK